MQAVAGSGFAPQAIAYSIISALHFIAFYPMVILITIYCSSISFATGSPLSDE